MQPPQVTSTHQVRRYPGAKELASRLSSQSPPTQPSSTTAVPAGVAVIGRATVITVNNTGSVVGSGATQIAPFCCSLTYQNTTYYSIPWIGSTPSTGEVMVIGQPPMLYVLGKPSNH